MSTPGFDPVVALGHTELFAGLPDEMLRALSTTAQQQAYEPGMVLVRQGETSDALYVVVRGEVKVQLEAPSAGVAELAILGPGSCVGEFSLIDSQPRSATVRAIDQVDTLVLRRTDFLTFIRAHPEVMDRLLLTIVERLRHTDDLVAELARLHAELRAAHEWEVSIGNRIQQVLLLDQPPRDVDGLRVAALTIPSQQIDGDFYDFFQHGDRSFDVIVADVMGKGIPAALLGAATKSYFVDALCRLLDMSRDHHTPQPSEIVALAHADMVRQLIDLESFVTLCYCRFDLNQQRLMMVDCGHTGIIHAHARTGQCEVLHGDNLPLGIREDEVYDQLSVSFDPGDLFVFFSDGITEATNASHEMFGTDRLLDCVCGQRDLEPEQLVDAIRSAVFAFAESDQLRDDLTCVVVKSVASSGPLSRAAVEITSDPSELRRAREFVRSVCRDLPGLGKDRVAELELAVSEAASNIMQHAYRGRFDQPIHLEAEVFPDRVAIRLKDFGDPFEPSTVFPPPLDGSRESGMGVYLISRSVDNVQYYRDGSGANGIVLVKAYRA